MSETESRPCYSLDESRSFYVGRRLSYNGALCTVRYHGTLPGTQGEWLGVEWDHAGRGKHDGKHQGKRFFQCRSSEPVAGSFIRPSRPSDEPRSFLDALRFKYGAEDVNSKSLGGEKHSISNGAPIEISGKVVEEVGFDRVRRQQAVLQNLRIVLLDELCLQSITLQIPLSRTVENLQENIFRTCPNIVELDLGWNLIETWGDVADICVPLRKLQVLKVR